MSTINSEVQCHLDDFIADDDICRSSARLRLFRLACQRNIQNDIAEVVRLLRLLTTNVELCKSINL